MEISKINAKENLRNLWKDTDITRYQVNQFIYH
jgi:hypothetical protein